MYGAGLAGSSGLHRKHHEDLYFSDGDIVLSAVNAASKDEVLLRVHKLILSHNSPVFRDMFAFPAGPQVNEMYDDVPVVRMPDDAADLVSLVRVLYNPGLVYVKVTSRRCATEGLCRSLELRRHDPDMPVQHYGLLSLATKYDVESIRSRIVDHLKSEWPAGLDEWYLLTHEIDEKARAAYLASDRRDFTIWERFFPEPASAIRMATDFGVPSILPAAYYRLAISNAGLEWGDDEYSQTSSDQMSARWGLLQLNDWRRYARGKEALVEKGYLYDVFDTVKAGSRRKRCSRKEDCDRGFQQFRRVIETQCDDVTFGRQPDFFKVLLRALDKTLYAMDRGLCLDCSDEVEKTVKDLLRDTWDELPDMFNLSN